MTLNKKGIKNLQCFLLFLGRGRSGSSLCGGLISCHPNVIIAHETEFINFNYNNELDLYNYLIDSQEIKRHVWEPLRKRDDWEWIRNYENIRVVGTKKQGRLIRSMSDFSKLNELKKKLSVTVKFINIYRNPFDNIATIYNKSQIPKNIRADGNMKSLDRAISYYFSGSKLTNEVIKREPVLNVQHELLVRQPRKILSEICGFLGIPILEDYLDYCEKFIWSTPRKTRDSVSWSNAQKERVIKLSNKYDFLKHYTWEEEVI
jgi:hypothetical protein